MTDPLDLRAMAERARKTAAVCVGKEWLESGIEWLQYAKALDECADAQASWANERAETRQQRDEWSERTINLASKLTEAENERAELERKLNELTCHIDHYREVESVNKGATYKDLVPVTHREAEMERQRTDDEQLIIALWRYGELRPVEGVVYPEGTHRSLLEKARQVYERHASLPLAAKGEHSSDCAIHNAPALPPGPCDCGADPTAGPALLTALYDIERRCNETGTGETAFHNTVYDIYAITIAAIKRALAAKGE